jgi:integrase
MDLVHVVRHKVLVEGRTQRAVARELGLARVTVRKYVDQAAPVRKLEVGPRPRPVWDAVAGRVQALLAESVRWTAGKQRLTATRLHELLVGEGHRVGVTVVKEAVAEQRAITENLQRQLKVVCPRVFLRSGRPIKSFRVAFRTACAEAGCPGRVLHDFRRTAVRNLVRPGIPERVAMQMTGHKTRSVFERYNIVSAGDLREAAKRLDAVTGTISGTIEQNQPARSKA